ncbi:MAG: hypothetical protein ABI065_09135 [Terrimesophilobacter sp.]
MSFSTLALVVLVGLLGPIAALRASWNIPIVAGELVAGMAIGTSGLGLANASEPTFSLTITVPPCRARY